MISDVSILVLRVKQEVRDVAIIAWSVWVFLPGMGHLLVFATSGEGGSFPFCQRKVVWVKTMRFLCHRQTNLGGGESRVILVGMGHASFRLKRL